MPGKNDFEARLARIAEQRGGPPAHASGPDRHPVPDPAPTRPGEVELHRPSPPRRGGAVALLALALLVPVGLGGAYLALSTGDAMAGRPEAGGFLTGLFAAPPEAQAFLPAAPPGWVRVTPADVAGVTAQEGLNAVAARYPGGDEALRGHPAMAALARYLEIESDPASMVALGSPMTEATGMYLHPEGEAVIVDLHLLRSDRANGLAEDPASWGDALAHAATAEAASHEMVQRVTLAGLPAVNVTRPPGASVLERPIVPGTEAPAQIRLQVPLSDRAVLRITGLASPIAAEALVAAADRPAISARAAQIGGRSPSLFAMQ